MLFKLAFLLVALPCATLADIYHWHIGSMIISDPTIRFRLDMYSPTTPGSYPVLVFLPGLSGVIPVSDYPTLLKTIAGQNVILISITKIENISPEKLAGHLSNFLEWAVKPDDGFLRIFAEEKNVKGVIPDIERIGFLTHSSAAHPLCQYLNSTCGPLKLIIMMNPVDGIDPFGIFKDFVTRMNNEHENNEHERTCCLLTYFRSIQIHLRRFHSVCLR
jgi:hypothetical protein